MRAEICFHAPVYKYRPLDIISSQPFRPRPHTIVSDLLIIKWGARAGPSPLFTPFSALDESDKVHTQTKRSRAAGWLVGRPTRSERERESIDLGKGAIRAAVSVTCESLAVKFEVHHASSALKLASATPALDIIYARGWGRGGDAGYHRYPGLRHTQISALLKSSKGAARPLARSLSPACRRS